MRKTTSPRSCLGRQPTGRILRLVCLRWVPTGKIFTSSTTKVDSEPPNGSNADITNQCEIEQALDVSAWYYRSYRAGLQGHFDPDDSSYGSFCLKKTTSGPIP
ncbi:hypothetical protein Tco_0839768 [Tanacetum coccineum]|uniref:Uncharacterized protein n=1 Tax=Tanacetum coccineum TaxID=301880 RepID=A0ABQ5ASQ6_9ASTR